MLVLSRGENEWIDVGGGLVRICVVRVKPNGDVRIGIDAPKELRILRSELIDRDKDGSGDCWRKAQVIPHSVVNAVDAT